MAAYRTTIFFGNGLGMGLDENHFNLKSGLEKAWELLPKSAKQRICPFLNGKTILEKEDDLLLVQQALFAIDTLVKSEVGKSHKWLTKGAKNFKAEFNKYVVNVAAHFFNYEEKLLPDEFVNNLCQFIENSKPDYPHVVTLNYDKLLYSALERKKTIFGDTIYNAMLVDGMWDKGFQKENLQRKYDNNFGWYLHLHGSPLFYSTSGEIFKDKISDFIESYSKNDYMLRNHIVLTHYKYKPQLITKSILLDAYWDYFGYALQESNRLIIFGYSGLDIHVNELIRKWKKYFQDFVTIEIVEYQESNPDEKDDLEIKQRQSFWNDSERFDGVLNFEKDKLIRLTSILSGYSFK